MHIAVQIWKFESSLRVRAAVVLAIALVSWLATPGTAPATFPGGNGKVAYIGGVYAQFNAITAADAEGSTYLTHTQKSERYPEYSADGTRIVWTRDEQQIWTMNADGSVPCEVYFDPTAHQVYFPTWAPDGGHIAFSSDSDIWVVDLPATCPATPLNPASAAVHHILGPDVGTVTGNQPTWSPDGSHIAFVYDIYPGTTKGLGTVKPDGSGFHALTVYSKDGYASSERPNWSPDGTRLAYERRYRVGAKGTAAVAVIDASSGDSHDVIPGSTPDGCGAQYSQHPVWTPDGLRITAYQVYCTAENTTAARQAIVDADGSHQQALSASVDTWQPCSSGCHPLVGTYPDADSDGVPDSTDACPNDSGPASNNGCPIPDTDHDGVPDSADACPTVAGPASNSGCPPPDADQDGVPDAADSCPHDPGPSTNSGCPTATPPPDADHDGVADAVDACPGAAGPSSNSGCPLGVTPADTDRDGVADAADACPRDPGPSANYGCPPPPPPSSSPASAGPDSAPSDQPVHGDLGITCGRSRIQQLDLNADIPAYRLAAAGAESCFFLVSNRAANELIDLAERAFSGDVGDAFFSTLGVPWVQAFVRDQVAAAVRRRLVAQAQSRLTAAGLEALARLLPVVGAGTQAAYAVDSWILKGGKALRALGLYALLREIRDGGSCVAFEIYEDPVTGRPAFDHDLLVSPRNNAADDADPSVWEHSDDGVDKRLLNLHCDPSTGDVTRTAARDTSRVLQGGWGTVVIDAGQDSGFRGTRPAIEVTAQPDATALVGILGKRAGTVTVTMEASVTGSGRASTASRRRAVVVDRHRIKLRRGQRSVLRLRPHGRTLTALRAGKAVPVIVRVSPAKGRPTVRRLTLHDACAAQPQARQAACRAARLDRPGHS